MPHGRDGHGTRQPPGRSGSSRPGGRGHAGHGGLRGALPGVLGRARLDGGGGRGHVTNTRQTHN
eukprot:11187579-Lingulodinium_polyedra.AAC.1